MVKKGIKNRVAFFGAALETFNLIFLRYVVLVETVAIAWKGTHEQLQLVIGRLRGRDTHLKELGLQIGNDLRQVLLLTGHDDIEVRPDHRLLLCGDNFQYLIDVGLGQFVAGVWH